LLKAADILLRLLEFGAEGRDEGGGGLALKLELFDLGPELAASVEEGLTLCFVLLATRVEGFKS
jgi:hypothetical protein